jgi:hypothetical protein
MIIIEAIESGVLRWIKAHAGSAFDMAGFAMRSANGAEWTVWELVYD